MSRKDSAASWSDQTSDVRFVFDGRMRTLASNVRKGSFLTLSPVTNLRALLHRAVTSCFLAHFI